MQAIRRAGRDIVNPSVIRVGRPMAQAGEHLIAGIREGRYARSMPLATQHLQIVQSSSGAEAGVIGASMLAIEHALFQGVVKALSAQAE
jgi:hypothetical protein